jgi:16S rRNA processing protein RimM
MSHPMQASDDPAWPDDAVEVARIMGAWGIKGGLKVKAFSADPQALFSSKRWFVRPRASEVLKPGAAALLPAGRVLRITLAREQGDHVVATAQDLVDRNAAEALTGWGVFIARASFPTPEDDEFYWVDLIGLHVSDRQGQPLGEVVGLIETGPHCVLRLSTKDKQGQERLIPFVAAYVDRVDMAARSITVDWAFDDGD